MQPTKYANANESHFFVVKAVLTEGVDDCDSVTMIYECGKAIVPNLVTDVVNTLELKKGVCA
jgi:hypothetical protein